MQQKKILTPPPTPPLQGRGAAAHKKQKLLSTAQHEIFFIPDLAVSVKKVIFATDYGYAGVPPATAASETLAYPCKAVK